MRNRLLFILGLISLPLGALAHHSFGGTYDTQALIEVEGQITRVIWRNPHVRYLLDVTNDNGEIEEWDIEANSLSLLRRANLTQDLVKVGDNVRISGWPARRSDTSVFVLNMLLPSGEEALWFRTMPLWSDRTVGDWDVWFSDGNATESDETADIFTVWTTNFGGERLWEPSYPLTETARAAQATFDPIADSPLLNCGAKGMPYIMEQPYPLQFIDQGESILLHMEEHDTMRTIYLDANAAPAEPSIPRLGLSIGRWESNVLIVETSQIDWTYFDPTGIPISAGVETVEQFTLSDDGGRLDYQVTVTDPAIFTEPVVLDKYWTRRAGAEVQVYECTLDDA